MLKKIYLAVIFVFICVFMNACGETCDICGSALKGKGYSVLGTIYCEQCFSGNLDGSPNETDPVADETQVTSETEPQDTHHHYFGAATCTKAATCVCGESRGIALGHSWLNATCTNPKTCARCSAVTGNALGHLWLEPTCTAAKTCSSCGITVGDALGHSWLAATYQSPEKCERCGTTRGDRLIPQFTGISIHSLPKKTVYNFREVFDQTGLIIQLDYSDGSYKTVDEGFTVTGFSSAEPGNKTITVSYKMYKTVYTTTFNVQIVVEDVKLSRLEPFEKKGVYDKKIDSYDKFGNYYDESIKFYEDYQRPYIVYYLNGYYDRLTGTIAVDEDAFKYTSGEMILNIYADDVLVYSKNDITDVTEPFNIDVDIKSCKYLKISVTVNYHGALLLYGATIEKGSV